MVITLLLRPFEASLSMKQRLKSYILGFKSDCTYVFYNKENERSDNMVTYLLLPELYGYRDLDHQCQIVLCQLDHQTT
ncbi:hypothetical protein MtrunA17_Chr4g0042371 [Medicago truncatula]|uniref:Uncharacterized protein n=1 Tax=Medicago truncatula TaxID=3880 RepID=A0A396I8N3_MEDTR|nr:hypothetical protein MtrunA17_Chr4g0042371 [Medicago truncatula]